MLKSIAAPTLGRCLSLLIDLNPDAVVSASIQRNVDAFLPYAETDRNIRSAPHAAENCRIASQLPWVTSDYAANSVGSFMGL